MRPYEVRAVDRTDRLTWRARDMTVLIRITLAVLAELIILGFG